MASWLNLKLLIVFKCQCNIYSWRVDNNWRLYLKFGVWKIFKRKRYVVEIFQRPLTLLTIKAKKNLSVHPAVGKWFHTYEDIAYQSQGTNFRHQRLIFRKLLFQIGQHSRRSTQRERWVFSNCCGCTAMLGNEEADSFVLLSLLEASAN